MRFEGENDEELMARFQAGDVEALSFLIKRSLPALAAIARKFTYDRESADDALQDALTTVWRKAESFNGDSKVITWLYRVIHNACVDAHRREKVRTQLNVSDEELLELTDGKSFADSSTTNLVVKEAVLSLPPDLRDPIVLVFLNQFSVEEAAKILEIPEGTVKSRCSRGKAQLAEILSELRPKV